MAGLGPWPEDRRIAVAVSGGADSSALALLAAGWGRPLALIVDHGLRPGSDAEAAATAQRLAGRGIPSRRLRLDGLLPGPALPERARRARYAALEEVCRAAGLAHLLLGHHAGDQAETVLMRTRRGSGPRGRAGMAAIAATRDAWLIRPLLGIAPVRLRATLRAAGLAWVEDPTNRDWHFLRPRLRAELAAADPAMLLDAAEAAGRARAQQDRAVAAELASRATIRPEGFALVIPGPLSAAALAALVQSISGAAYPPRPAAVASWAAAPRAMTIAGTRLMPAGRLGGGWLLVREAAAMAPPVMAAPGAVWDGRFALGPEAAPSAGCMFGAVGAAAAGLRAASRLPAAVLATLPALWHDGRLVAVSHIPWPDAVACAPVPLAWQPARPACGNVFVPSSWGCATMAPTLC